ncbi:MAG: membrane dipeptidase [Myxococcales bacterium]|nr:membrane dipeptidase [Myxococcales bacterium]
MSADVKDFAATARALHERAILVDLHVDCIIQQRLFGYDVGARHECDPRPQWGSLPFDLLRAGVQRFAGGRRPLFYHADVPRMIDAGYTLVGFGLHYWPWQSERGWDEIQRQLDYFDELVERDSRLIRAGEPADVRAALGLGKLAAFVGLEGVHGLGAGGSARANDRRLRRLETLFQRGARYVTLAHFYKNDAAVHGFGVRADQRTGLSPFGRDVVAAMNDIGLVVDLAHVGEQCALDACYASRAPVMVTHTGLRGFEPTRTDKYVTRNITDELLVEVARRGGVVGMIMCPPFIGGTIDGSVDDVVAQIRYGTRLLDEHRLRGDRCFAIGSDFDGWIPDLPRELDDVCDTPRLTEAMLRGGLDEQHVERIWGENFLACWQQALDAAQGEAAVISA